MNTPKKTPFFLYSDTTQRSQPDELDAVKAIFGEENVSYRLTDIQKNHIVIPRFRAIPFGKELEAEVANMGASLINSYREHRSIADMWNWVNPLAEAGLTAPAYRASEVNTHNLPENEWFVKGETNSIKNRWFECCYAPTTKDLPTIINNNRNDTYVGTQEIIIRPFQHYRQIGTAVDNRPVFNERRCFVLGNELISYADYWASLPEFKTPALDESQFQKTIDTAIRITSEMGLAPFRVIDVAEYPDGSWQVVELNDGVMSGLSENNPNVVWSAVAKHIKNI